MALVQKDYRFEGPAGEVGLIDLCEGRTQLIVGHFMFDPEWQHGCPSCSAGAEEMSRGHLEHLHARDTWALGGVGGAQGARRVGAGRGARLRASRAALLRAPVPPRFAR